MMRSVPSLLLSLAIVALVVFEPTSLQAEVSNLASAIEENFFITYEREKLEAKSTSELWREMSRRNEAALEVFDGETVLATSSMTRERAQLILDGLHLHPVVGDNAYEKYDPKYEVGFCFGRAAFVHWQLLADGVPPDAIAKVFVLGNLRYGFSRWDYHMATIVRARDGQWLVIDGLRDDVLTLDEWRKFVTSFDRDPNLPSLRLFFADPRKFQPISGSYSEEKMFLPLYNGYFKDLLTSFFGEIYL